MKRWLLLALGLVVGVGLGLLYTWQINPVQYFDTEPALLHSDYKDEYVRLVALTYQVEGNLAVAQRRLERLEEPTATGRLVALTESLVERELPSVIIVPLAELARDLDVATPAMLPYLEGSGS